MFLCLPARATFVVDTDLEFVSETQKNVSATNVSSFTRPSMHHE